MKLRDYAKLHSISYRAAWNRFKLGKIPNAKQDEFGRINVFNYDENLDYKQAAIYCRVSSHKQKADLVRQADRVTNFAINNGYQITELVSEVGSGVNDNRKKLIKLLHSQKWNTLIVENSDRLTRFGFNYISELLKLNNKRIVVINLAKDDKQDLMQDMISILYSFSARMYGKRKSSKSKARKLLEDINCA